MTENGQYHMPQSAPITPPSTERGRYEAIKDIELEIEEMRALASDGIIVRYESKNTIKRWTKHLSLVVKQTGSIESRLVEIESQIGGRVLQRPAHVVSQRFWFHGGDWFYESSDGQSSLFARYHISDDRIYKLVQGKAIAFSEAEANHLLQIIPLYFQAVCRDLYEKDVNSTQNMTLQLAV